MGTFRPSYYCRPVPLPDPEDPIIFFGREGVPYANEIVSALAKDDSYEFTKIVDTLDVNSLPGAGFKLTKPLLLKWAIDHRALRCAESLLPQSSAGHIDLPLRLPCIASYGLSAIHRAATEFLPDFVNFFLKYDRFATRSPCADPRSEYYLMIPIEAALEKLRKNIFWTPTQSVYGLIFALCGTMEVKKACCTIGHLMTASTIEDIIETIYYYARGGKIIELAALLYVDGICRSGILKGLSNDEYVELRTSVATNMLSCSKEDNYFAVDGSGVALSLGKKREMMSILLLLEIFCQTEFSMLGFDTSQEILAKRMKDAGFDWAADDLQYMGNVHATEVVKHHKKTDDQPPPVFFSTNLTRMQIIYPRATAASHYHEKRGISTAMQAFQASKSVVYLPVMDEPNENEPEPYKPIPKPHEPGYVHIYHYNHVIRKNEFQDLMRDEEVKPYVEKIFSALRKDNCAKFIKVVKDETQKASFASFEIAPSLFTWTIIFRAPKCAEAMLSGETEQSVDLNVPPNVYQPLPIHVAVTEFLPEFVNLFIKYGARLDIPSGHLLPLDACLEELRKNILWTPAHSVYELILDLCSNIELEQAYLTISNIMRAMPVEQTQQAICHYILHQKMVELAILLYVAAISKLEVFEGLSLEYLALRQFAAANILSRSEELLYFLVDGNGVTVSNDKKWVMKSMMLLFEIFRRTNFAMLGFNSGRIDLQNRIQDAGFDLINLQNPCDVHDHVAASGVGEYPQVVRVLEPTADIPRAGSGVGKYHEVVRLLEPTADLPRGVFSPMICALKPKRVQISHQRSVFASNFCGLSSSAQTFPALRSFKSKPVLLPCTPMDAEAWAVKATHAWPLLFGSSLRICSVLAAAIWRTVRV